MITPTEHQVTMAHHTLAAGRLASGSLICPFDHAAPMAESYFLLPPAPHAATPASRGFIEWLDAELAVDPGLPCP